MDLNVKSTLEERLIANALPTTPENIASSETIATPGNRSVRMEEPAS